MNHLENKVQSLTMTRAQCIVHRGNKLLMIQHHHQGRTWWCLPGGSVEPGESPQEAALRELREECSLEGVILRQTSLVFHNPGKRTYTFLIDIGDQTPRIGQDPEFKAGEQVIVDMQWLSLAQIPERDRAFLWQAGLLTIPMFREEGLAWGDLTSYPPER